MDILRTCESVKVCVDGNAIYIWPIVTTGTVADGSTCVTISHAKPDDASCIVIHSPMPRMRMPAIQFDIKEERAHFRPLD